MALERVPLEHLPPGYAVYGALFRGVANAAFLQTQLVARNATFEYAFVDAAAVVSRAHLLAAVYAAVLAHAAGALKTPNVHSETVLSLTPSLNIAEAYRRFGITAATKDVLVVKVLVPDSTGTNTTAESIWAHLRDNVEGTAEPLTDANVAACTDVARVKKYFKLNGAAALGKDAPARELEALVLGAMALRGL